VLADELLIATGKTPNLDLGLEAAAIEFDPATGVKVDEALRTTNPRVFAAGDVAGPFRFTHAASYQGAIACNNMFSSEVERVDYGAMPRCVFTSPEVASVGLTEAQARERYDGVLTGMTGIDASDRALTSGEMDGFVKVVAAADGRLVGGVAVAPRAGEMIHELALAVRLSATAAQVASAIHAFPTFSEALGAACAEV
jgi:pyruvate/2-oxoglutarate dehydrogenase complex dihydrolipoamide dehydrogenase (E3) component